jgi:hypothetical protein
MRRPICGSLLLVGVCLLTGTGAWAQQNPDAQNQSPVSADLAITYTTEMGKLATANGGTFWLQGGGADAAVNFWEGFGIAANFTGGLASNVAPGVNLNQVEFTAGPRYTHQVWTGHSGKTDQRRLQLFGQGLFGGVHAFGGVFPGISGVTATAGSFALNTGGGMNLYLSRSLGVRLLEADYVRTWLPNNGSNSQNDLRLSFGIAYHIGKH